MGKEESIISHPSSLNFFKYILSSFVELVLFVWGIEIKKPREISAFQLRTVVFSYSQSPSMSCITGDYGDSALCVATKILNLKAIPSRRFADRKRQVAVRCNKNTKSESYSQFRRPLYRRAARCALQQKY